MTSQIIFKIDKKIKDRAMDKAEREGIPFASFLKYATSAYADDRLGVGLIVEEKFNAKTQRELDRAIAEIAEGKGLSPRFSNARDAIAWLKK